MGADRSLRKVEQQLNKSHALIGRWSTTWSWVKRSRDYEEELRRQELAAKKAEIKKMQTRQVQTAVLVQKKALEALGKLNLETMYAKDIIRFIEVGAKLERELRQSATEESKAANGEGEGASSLSSTIISAYKKRMEDGEC